MNGICGIYSGQDPRVAGTLWRMLPEGTALSEAHGGVIASRPWQWLASDRVFVACHADLPGETTPAPERIASLYEQHGTALAAHLRGWFSLLLWDRRERMLLAAIDGFGVQRLVYRHDEAAGRLIIASHLDELLRTGLVERKLNPRTVPNILNFTANLAPDTALAGVRRLEPGHILIAHESRVQVHPYWDLRYQPSRDGERELCRRMEQAVGQSVARNAEDTTGTGAFLSGGTDSSTVVGMMSRVERGRPVNAFSIGFDDPGYNELQYAELAARSFGARHQTYTVSPDDCWNALPKVLAAFDEPYANSSAIPTYFCAKLAADHGVNTMLAGDGGDELFGGNEHYRIDKIFHLYQSVPGFLRKAVIEPALSVVPFHKGRSYVNRANLQGAERLLSFQLLAAHPPGEIFADGLLQALDGYTVRETPNRHYWNADAADHLNRLLYVDAKIILGDNDLLKVARMTELAGVRPRFPFLDRDVVECAATIPPSLKLKGFEKRYLFKRAFRNLLPAEIIQKKKHGFGIPVSSWLKTDPRLRGLLRDTLGSQKARERGYFRPGFVETLMQRHEEDRSSYYGDVLWTMLTLELWHHQYLDPPAVSA